VALPPRPLPLPPLPVRARDLLLLLVIFFLGRFPLVWVIAEVFLGGAVGGLVPTLVLLVTQTLFLLGLAWFLVLRPHGLGLAEVGLRPVHPGWYRLAIAVGVVCVPLVAVANLAIQTLMGGPIENPQLENLAPEGFSWTSLITMVLLVGVFVPLVEEVVFRGLIFGWLRRHLRFLPAALLSALLFGAVHMVPQLMPALSIMGFVLAAVVERSGSLWPAIIVHGLFNSLMTIAYYTVLAAAADGYVGMG